MQVRDEREGGANHVNMGRAVPLKAAAGDYNHHNDDNPKNNKDNN